MEVTALAKFQQLPSLLLSLCCAVRNCRSPIAALCQAGAPAVAFWSPPASCADAGGPPPGLTGLAGAGGRSPRPQPPAAAAAAPATGPPHPSPLPPLLPQPPSRHGRDCGVPGGADGPVRRPPGGRPSQGHAARLPGGPGRPPAAVRRSGPWRLPSHRCLRPPTPFRRTHPPTPPAGTALPQDEAGLTHLCWHARDAAGGTAAEPEQDVVIIPGESSFSKVGPVGCC